jgi:NADPH-dependent 2,4-dienoyl-CoA reductase/sulfur reductase-like enzyme
MDLGGVFTYRSVVCARRITDYIQKRNPKAAVVVGGGILGVEMAETFRKMGLAVTLLAREERLLTGFFSAEMAAAVAKRMEKDGVALRFGQELAEIRGDEGRVTEVLTKSGDLIPGALVAVAVGARPMTRFMEGSGIPLVGGAVVVNSMLRSGPAGVYAAGDAAALGGGAPAAGKSGGWLTAASQGERAGANMAGEEEDWRETVYFNASSVFSMRYALVGRHGAPEGGSVRWVEVDAGVGEKGRIVTQNGRIIGGAFLGMAALAWDAARAVDRGARINGSPARIEGGELSLLANGGAPAALV